MITSKPLLTELLNLAGIEVEDYSIEPEHIVLHVEAFCCESTCPHCGTVSKNVHQNHFHPVRDLSIMNRPVTLMVNRRQFKCHVCGKPFSEALDFVDKRRRFTNRFENQVVWSLINSDISNTAKMFNLSNDEVFSILKHVGDRDINPNWQIVKRLGIDEISMRKFHKHYVVVLVDLDLQKPLAFIDSRKKNVIVNFLKTLPEGVLENIQEVSIDMTKTYKTIVNELMPNAVITVDRFHVMKAINDELDKSRRETKKELDKEKKGEILEGTKYIFLQNEEDLSDQEKAKLEKIQQELEHLAKMQSLKEEIRDIFESEETLGMGTIKLSDWLKQAQDFYKNSCKSIANWFGEIVGYFENRTTNGLVEGINNKLKLIKRRGYGFTNVKNFELRCLMSWYFTGATA